MEEDPYHDTGFPSTSAALPATLSGWSSCKSFARYAKFKQEFPSQFLKLKGGPTSHESVLRPVRRSRAGAAGGRHDGVREAVQALFSDPEARKEVLSCRHVDAGHGRVETRIATVRERKGRTERAVRHFIMSAEIPPERLPDLVRSHWEIENGFPPSSRRRNGRGADAEPNLERAGVPLRPPAHRPGHRAPHGRRALAQGTDAYRLHERRITARSSRERGRQILGAKALRSPAAVSELLPRARAAAGQAVRCRPRIRPVMRQGVDPVRRAPKWIRRNFRMRH